MESFIIEGGHRLSGTITPQGAKNEALEVICATLLTEDEVVISNVPDILDVNNLILLLKDMGVKVSLRAKGEYAFRADELNLDYLQSDEFVRKCSSLRGSVLMIGPLLGRFGRAVVAKPGGDKIGRRRLDTHFLGFRQLGARFVHDEQRNVYAIEATRLKGTYMLLDEASVTGTANIIMAAVMAKGTTTIYNAACEPYIQQLCHLLNRMGASISGIGSNLITIVGVDSLHGTTHRVLPDMIEVGSFIGMAAMVGDGIRIREVSVKDLGIIPDAFRRLGVKIQVDGDDLVIPDGEKVRQIGICASDMQMYHGLHKFMTYPVVVGHDHKKTLRAGRMTSPDIRAGIALLIAALSAKGTSRIANISQIDRGYEDIEARLNALGAKITRVDD